MNQLYENIDLEIGSLPWNLPEQLILSEFLHGSVSSHNDEKEKGLQRYSSGEEDFKDEEIIAEDGQLNEVGSLPDSYLDPLTPVSPRFSLHSLVNRSYISPPHVTSPISNEFCGDFTFKLTLETQPKKVANPDWIFSSCHNKLYIKPQTPCPIKFSTTSTPPQDAYIRAMPVFKQKEHVKDVVRCCPNHTLMDQSEHDLAASMHFVRCDNQAAEYHQCTQTGRLSVRIPFPGSPPRQVYDEEGAGSHELFSFMCNNSCGGLNRRTLEVIFTLESGNASDVYGRCVVDVRVCACPGRDSKQDNEALTKPGRKRKRLAGRSALLGSGDLTSRSAQKAEEDNTVYNLKICGYNNYLILKRLATALELFANMENRFSNSGEDKPERVDSSKQNGEVSEPDSTITRSAPAEVPSGTNGQLHYSTRHATSSQPWYPQGYVVGNSQTPTYRTCFTLRRKLVSVEYIQRG